jgi:hypothetical protein
MCGNVYFLFREELMSGTIIGCVKSGKSKKTFDVKWDHNSRDIYVSYAGWTNVGKGNSATEAMTKAEAFLYNK